MASLLGSISFQRPDLFPVYHSFLNIPLNPPKLFQEDGVPEVGELMLASFAMDSNFVSSVSNRNSWWIGEKYDGIRFCYNPKSRSGYSRLGNEIPLDESVLLSFPKTFVDAELWFGRGSFLLSQQFLGGSKQFSDQYLRFIAFDEPNIIYNNLKYEARYQILYEKIIRDHPVMIIAPRMAVKRTKDVTHLMSSVVSHDGEGLILQRPLSVYEHGRTKNLIKLKSSPADAEGIVTDVQLGSITLKMPDGRIVKIEETQGMEHSLKKGEIVTFSFDGYSKEGDPLNPVVSRVRSDLTWNDLALSSSKDSSSSSSPLAKVKPFGFWTASDGANMRKFFEEFAHKLNMNPLVPETWYTIPRKALEEIQGGDTIMKHFKGYVNTLMNLFPNIGLEESKFPTGALSNYWGKIKNRRETFDKIAKEGNFDPLVSENWYYLSAERVVNPVVKGILYRYSGNYAKALSHVYPEVEFNANMFLNENHWPQRENRRKFFMDIASHKQIDPLVPESWFPFQLSEILQFQSACTVLSFHSGSLAKALEDLFPELKLKLVYPTDMNFGNRKRFFESFALKENFDPTNPANWYNITNAKFLSLKGAAGMLAHYNNSLSKALIHIFPTIGLLESQFSHIPRNFWQDKTKRRKKLEEYAWGQGFDPLIPHNWYSSKLSSATELYSVLSYYNYSPSKALLDLFPEIGLNIESFFKNPNEYWQHAANRRHFFDSYALHYKFDPLVATNWTPHLSQLKNSKAAKKIVKYHGGIEKTLSELYT